MQELPIEGASGKEMSLRLVTGKEAFQLDAEAKTLTLTKPLDRDGPQVSYQPSLAEMSGEGGDRRCPSSVS